MSIRDSVERYGGVSKFLHWALLLLVVLQFVLAFMMELYADGSAAKTGVMVTHQSAGVLVMAAAIAFVLWRIANPRPSLQTLPAWQRNLARVTHWAIYLLIFLQPLSGILMVVNSEHGLHFFGLTLAAGAGSEAVKEIGEAAHGVLPLVLLIALVLHVAGALYHQYVARDSILKRMLPGSHA